MASDTHISVSFSPNEKEAVASLAKEMLEKIANLDTTDGVREAKDFLEDCVTGRGYVCGWKGALYHWGYVGNYTNAEKFVEVLMPFWDQLIGKREDCCLSHDHVNVFYEPEQSQAAQCFEIYREETEADGDSGKIIVKHHENLPFCWNQF